MMAFSMARTLPKTEVAISREDVLLTRSAAGDDPAAKRRLLMRAVDRVHKVTSYLTRGASESEDLAQVAMVQIVQSAGSFRGESTLEYWIDRITVQTAAKHFEKRQRRKKLREGAWHPGPAVRDIEEEVALLEVRRRLSDLLSEISPPQRTAVVLHYLFGYEVSEIADLTRTKHHTVRGRLREGLKRIRHKILADPALRDWVQEGEK